MTSNNNKDKKTEPLSAASLCKTASMYVTRAQTADKVSSSNKLTRIINPEPNTASDQHIMLPDNSNMLAEDYIGDLRSSLPPTFEDKTEYTWKTQTEHERNTRQNNFTHMYSLSQLPAESDCGSLYTETDHNQNNHQIKIIK